MHKEFGARSLWIPLAQLTSKGPIVRIGPDQLHVSDPDFLLSIFAPTAENAATNTVLLPGIFGNSEASIATIDHELHRLRSGAQPAKYFSKEAIRRAEPIIHGALSATVQALRANTSSLKSH